MLLQDADMDDTRLVILILRTTPLYPVASLQEL